MEDIKKIVLEIKEIKYYNVEISEDNGYTIPKNHKEFIELVDSFRSDPKSFLLEEKPTAIEVILDSYTINETI